MTDQTETKAPKRSAARATLAVRIARRQQAHAMIGERHKDARRLTMIGEAASALAAQLQGAKQRDAAILAEHVISGTTGGLPSLADDARGSLIARLAEAEARAEAAVPALAIVQQKITDALADFNSASSAVSLVTLPVVEEEIDTLIEQIKELIARLNPLTKQLIGARSYAFSQAHRSHGDQRTDFLALGNRLDPVMKTLGITPRNDGDPSQGLWEAFSQRLTTDADAVVASNVEAV